MMMGTMVILMPMDRNNLQRVMSKMKRTLTMTWVMSRWRALRMNLYHLPNQHMTWNKHLAALVLAQTQWIRKWRKSKP